MLITAGSTVYMKYKIITTIMDKYSGKRGATGGIAPRKRYNIGHKDSHSSEDQNAQFCNRIGCHGRIKYSNQDTKIGSSGKAKCSSPGLCSSNGDEIAGSSSRSGSIFTGAKGSYRNSKKKLSCQSGFDPSESSQSGDSEASQLSPSPDRNPAKMGIPSAPSKNRHREMFQQKNTQSASSIPSVSRSSGLGTVNNSNKSRCMKSLKCNSISDAIQSNCSSSGSKSSRKNVTKKRNPEEESNSSHRRHVSSSTSGVSISSSRHSSFASGEDSSSGASVRTGRSTYVVNQNRTRFSYQQNGRISSRGREPAVRISRFPGSEHFNVSRTSFSQQFSANGSSSGSSSASLSSSNDDNRSTLMPFTSDELDFSHLVNRDALPHYSMNGIAEVLLALERIEQGEEMTREQLLALETSLFLSGLNLYDQHQDMRLDIDNMSYEELLALGERMGTVSTALSEEALLKCVKRSVYQVTPSEERFAGSDEDGDDVKCCICQEEYEMGDEIGKVVECQHIYHMGCIDQWLRLKNWCPICKTAAAPPESSNISCV